jgi:hypothetical protein
VSCKLDFSDPHSDAIGMRFIQHHIIPACDVVTHILVSHVCCYVSLQICSLMHASAASCSHASGRRQCCHASADANRARLEHVLSWSHCEFAGFSSSNLTKAHVLITLLLAGNYSTCQLCLAAVQCSDVPAATVARGTIR